MLHNSELHLPDIIVHFITYEKFLAAAHRHSFIIVRVAEAEVVSKNISIYKKYHRGTDYHF